MNILGFFQRLGRALQLPIAVLPVAALLLRFGQPDLLNVAFIAQAGGAIFDNLALIFAIGVASSWSKDSAGAAALAGAVGYFVLTKAMVGCSCRQLMVHIWFTQPSTAACSASAFWLPSTRIITSSASSSVPTPTVRAYFGT